MSSNKSLPLFPVTTVGSWPRSTALLRAMGKWQRGKMTAADFSALAEEEIAGFVQLQEKIGLSVVTDGELQRDNFYSFVAAKLDGVKLMPLAEMLGIVEDKAAFGQLLKTLDAPAFAIKNPTCVGRISLREALALREYQFLAGHTTRQSKVTLPGPYLLTRAMWVKEATQAAYESKEELAEDIIRIVRDEAMALQEAGVDFLQFDEPVLTELVFTQGRTRTFMCAALSAIKDPTAELEFAVSLMNRVVDGLSGQNEATLLSGSYAPLVPYLERMHVQQLVLEFATSRAGELEALLSSAKLKEKELGLGVVNPRTTEIESVESIVERVHAALRYLPPDKIFLNPDCGFGTFALRPVNTAELAEKKLRMICEAAEKLRGEYMQ
jgi:5-methyltetrahydropteroyltriglutamate--homocysteine methyltransferase